MQFWRIIVLKQKTQNTSHTLVLKCEILSALRLEINVTIGNEKVKTLNFQIQDHLVPNQLVNLYIFLFIVTLTCKIKRKARLMVASKEAINIA